MPGHHTCKCQYHNTIKSFFHSGQFCALDSLFSFNKMAQTCSTTTDEPYNHNNGTVPMGKHESCFSRCFRDSLQEKETGIREMPRLKVWGEQTEQSNCWWRQRGRGGESPHLKYSWQSPSLFLSTGPPARCPLWWKTIVLFDQERHKEGKRERRRRVDEEGGAGLGAFQPAGCALPGDETQSEARMWWRLVYGQAYFSIVLCRFEIQFKSFKCQTFSL